MSYQKIKFKIQYLEQRIKNELIRSKKNKNLSLKYLSLKGIILPKFRLFFLSIRLFLWGIVFNIARLYFILFKDPALSFNLFFNQKNLEVCDYSYYEFKIIQKKARVFSLAGLMTLVSGIVIVSLILNLATGPIQYSDAATYYWVQDSWTTQSSDTADHTNNRTGWVNYLVKDSNLSAGANLSLASTDGSWAQTSDSDFNEGTYDANEIEVSNNDIALKLDCGLCGEHIWGSGCQPKAAGEYDLSACQKCDGASLTPVNYTDNTQDTVGPNTCGQICKKCSGGSCVNQVFGEDLFNQCPADCNGSGSCQKRCFITSVSSDGDLGGLAGGDQICQTRANAASLDGQWTAWLSTNSVNAKDRIQDNKYYLVGTFEKVCDDLADLTDGSIDHAIDRSEFGQLTQADVWTGTLGDGTASDGANCIGWVMSGAGDYGRKGCNIYTDHFWTNCSNETKWCSQNKRIYCFED